MRKKIGTFKIGYVPVDFFVTESEGGGTFRATMSEEENSWIEIGVGHPQLDWTIDAMLHEIVEMSACHENKIFEPVGGFHWNTQNRLFVFTHKEFCDIIGRVSTVIEEVIPLVKKEWKMFHKKKKEKK